MQRVRNWVDSLKPYLKKPMLATFLFGISSGFPLTIVFSLMSGWLKDNDVSKSDIGLFALVGTAYMLKFLWAPFIDGIKLGRLERILGHRRSWLLVIISLIVLTILFLSRLNPATDLFMVATVVLILAILSASQDIVIDAYRIEIVKDEELGHGAAMISFGYRTGNLITGYLGFVFAEFYGWNFALSVLAGLAVSGVIAAFWIGEPPPPEPTGDEEEDFSFAHFFSHSVVLPFKDFMQRQNWLIIIAFILFLKLGDAMADFMMTPFHRELGFSNLEIANYSKAIGTFALYGGLALGAILYYRLGAYVSLLVSAILMMLTNLVFIWAFYQGYDTNALAISVGMEKFATGLGNTVVVAYLSALCNREFTATQYALLSALSGVGRTVLGSTGGFVVDSVGWVNFFLVTTVAALPGVMLLWVLWRRQVGSDIRSKSGD